MHVCVCVTSKSIGSISHTHPHKPQLRTHMQGCIYYKLLYFCLLSFVYFKFDCFVLRTQMWLHAWLYGPTVPTQPQRMRIITMCTWHLCGSRGWIPLFLPAGWVYNIVCDHCFSRCYFTWLCVILGVCGCPCGANSAKVTFDTVEEQVY